MSGSEQECSFCFCCTICLHQDIVNLLFVCGHAWGDKFGEGTGGKIDVEDVPFIFFFFLVFFFAQVIASDFIVYIAGFGDGAGAYLMVG